MKKCLVKLPLKLPVKYGALTLPATPIFPGAVKLPSAVKVHRYEVSSVLVVILATFVAISPLLVLIVFLSEAMSAVFVAML